MDSVLIAADIVRLIREPAISNAVYEVNQIDNKSVNLIFKIEENITLHIYTYLFNKIFSSIEKMKTVLTTHAVGHYSYLAKIYFQGNNVELSKLISNKKNIKSSC